MTLHTESTTLRCVFIEIYQNEKVQDSKVDRSFYLTYKERMRTVFFYILLLLNLCTVAGETVNQHVRIDPLPYWVNTRTWGEVFPSGRMIEASLTASGLSGNRLLQYEKKYRELLFSFRAHELPKLKLLNEKKRGDDLLVWMHEHLLGTYAFEQTFMNTLIDTGNFNCVSSSVLYLILAREAGLTVSCVEVKDHVFCRVKADGIWIDVETTTPFGFNPGIKKKFTTDFKQTGFTYVPPGNYHYRTVISDREVIALILQNRMALLQKSNDYNRIVGLAVDRWTLTGKKKHFKEMNDAFRNRTAVLNNKGKYLDAFQFLLRVSSLYHLTAENEKLMYSLANNYLITFLDDKNYNGAKVFLQSVENSLLPEDRIKMESMLYKSSLTTMVNRQSFDRSMPEVRTAYDSGLITMQEWENFASYLYQKKAAFIADSKGYLAAWEFLKQTPPEVRNLSKIKKVISIMHQNWTASVHNSFVESAQKKDFTRAEKILMEGLSIDPGNKIFAKDLANLKR